MKVIVAVAFADGKTEQARFEPLKLAAADRHDDYEHRALGKPRTGPPDETVIFRSASRGRAKGRMDAVFEFDQSS